jgi:hypothetical protein
MELTTCSKQLTINEKINIRSYYSAGENRVSVPYRMTFGFLDIYQWNLKPFKR